MKTQKPSVQECKSAIQEVRKTRAFDPQSFGRALAERMDSRKTRIHPTTRHGDFDATPISGSRFHAVCRRCKIEGSIFLPDDCNRNRCPKCSKLPIEEWQRAGFAGLLPPEPKPVKVLSIATISAVDSEEEIVPSIDDMEEVVIDYSTATSAAGSEGEEPSDLEPEVEEVEDVVEVSDEAESEGA